MSVTKKATKKRGARKVLATTQEIERRILIIRGEKVMLDADIAHLYGVETRVLIQAMKRNAERFPNDFMFQLNREEFQNLISHFVISSLHGGRRALPYAFTEQGVAMLASVLRSKRAVLVNIEIVRAFVRLRGLLATNKKLSRQLISMQKKYDAQFSEVFAVIDQLIKPPSRSKNPIGFIWHK